MNIFLKNAAIVSVASLALIVGGFLNVYAAGPAPVDLSSAGNFVILSETGITDVSPSIVTGNVGASPISGAAILVTCAEVTGTIYSVDAAGPLPCRVTNDTLLTAAIGHMESAYTNAAGRATPDGTNMYSGNLGGQTIAPGLYKWTTDVTIPTNVTLSGGANDYWIFQIAGNLTIASGGSVPAGVKVLLSGGAQASNVFWQVGGVTGATLGTYSTFNGTILSAKQIILETGAVLNGRALAQTQVTLDANTASIVPTASTYTVTQPNQRQAGTINVVKTVLNNNGGTKAINDFALFVDTTRVTSGVSTSFPAHDGYMITETGDAGYVRSFSGDCDSNGRISIGSGQNKFCVITNDDVGPITTATTPLPLVDIVVIPTPLARPNGPGSISYAYTLRNIGTVPMSNVTVVGDTCSPILLTSGDTNMDAKLDPTETWVYHCSITLQETRTSTVVATGWANGHSATDIASATVVIGLPIVPPLIHLTKISADPTPSSSGPHNTIYTYTVTNPGTVAVHDIVLVDNTCNQFFGPYGDTNNDKILDPSETWIYSCIINLTKTTTGTAVVSGDANGLSVRDFAIATALVVTSPSLPYTGLSPRSAPIKWSLLTLSGLIMSIMISAIVVVRKRSNE